MVNVRQVDYLVQALTRNQLTADEFQRAFTKLSHEERMLVLEGADKAVYGPQSVAPATPPPRSTRQTNYWKPAPGFGL